MNNDTKWKWILFALIGLFLTIGLVRRLRTPPPAPVDRIDSFTQLELSGHEHAQSVPITIVTAYYEIPSKHSVTEYQQWFENFSFLNPKCPLVVFSTGPALEWIRARCAKRAAQTRILDLPMEQFTLHRYTAQLQKQTEMDPERAIHTSQCYLVWNEKPHFVRRAIQADYFKTPYYGWMDCGMIRDPRLSTLMMDFFNPHALRYLQARIQDRVMFLAIDKSNLKRFQPRDSFHISIVNHTPHTHDAIAAGIFVGTRASCDWFATQHLSLFQTYLRRNRFAGKEQNLYANLVVNAPSRYELLQPFLTQTYVDVFQTNRWFYPVNFFIGGNVTHRSLHTPVFNGRLGNNIFQVAAVYGIARRHRGLCALAENAAYTKSVFRRFLTVAVDTNSTETLHVHDSHALDTTLIERGSIAPLTAYNGFFQHYMYIEPFYEEFRALLTLPEEAGDDSMFLHLRFGDYLSEVNRPHHYIDLRLYFERCLKRISSDVTFKVFSDEPTKAEAYIQEHLAHQIGHRYRIVDANERQTLGHMMQCTRGGICSNSTFSWWGGRLNPHPNKQIFFPRQFYPKTSKYRHMNISGLFHPSFTIIDPE